MGFVEKQKAKGKKKTEKRRTRQSLSSRWAVLSFRMNLFEI